jgi:hypothetical protein
MDIKAGKVVGEEVDMSDMEHLFRALLKSRDAFEEYFENEGLEGAYFSVDFHGFVHDCEFRRWKKLVMSDVTADPKGDD